MLLRSCSTPILKTYAACQLLSSTHEVDHGFSPSRTSVSMSLQRTSSESQLKLCSLLGKENTFFKSYIGSSPAIIKENEEMNVCMETASSLLSDKPVPVSACGGDDGVYRGGYGGGSWRSGGHNGPYGSDQVDVYYQGMIKTYPGDSLLLANYAKFLKEVQGDTKKAEEICEKAILLSDERDGNVLSMYGDLIWNNRKDCARAQSYFDQAVQSSPDDCYVLASYAKFLWDVPGEEEEDEETRTCSPPQSLCHGYTPLTAAPT